MRDKLSPANHQKHPTGYYMCMGMKPQTAAKSILSPFHQRFLHDGAIMIISKSKQGGRYVTCEGITKSIHGTWDCVEESEVHS